MQALGTPNFFPLAKLTAEAEERNSEIDRVCFVILIQRLTRMPTSASGERWRPRRNPNTGRVKPRTLAAQCATLRKVPNRPALHKEPDCTRAHRVALTPGRGPRPIGIRTKTSSEACVNAPTPRLSLPATAFACATTLHHAMLRNRGLRAEVGRPRARRMSCSRAAPPPQDCERLVDCGFKESSLPRLYDLSLDRLGALVTPAPHNLLERLPSSDGVRIAARIRLSSSLCATRAVVA